MASTMMSMIENATKAKEAKEAHDAKDSEPKNPLLPVVLGSMVIKLAYYVLGFISLGLLFATTYSILSTAVTEDITSVDITLKNQITFPAVWICMEKKKMDELASFDFYDLGANEQCKARGRDPANGDFNLLVTKMDNEFKAAESCVTLVSGTKFTNWLALRLDTMTGEADRWSCYSFNEDGTLKDDRTSPMTIKLSGEIALKEAAGGREHGFMMPLGFASPDQIKDANNRNDFASVFNSNLQWTGVDIFNKHTIVQHTLDQLVDLRDEFQFQPKSSIADDDDVQSMYQATASSRKLSSLPDANDEFEIDFRTSTFFVKEVVMRKKSFQEVWTEIGGAWATAMLLLSLFFAQRTVQDRNTLKYVHVFGLSSTAAQDTLVQEYEQSKGHATRQPEEHSNPGDNGGPGEPEAGQGPQQV